MAITKKRKEELVAQYTQLVKEKPSLVLASYSGLTVKELEVLRGKIRESGGELHVIQNKIVGRVFNEAKVSLPEGALVGPTAIGFAADDVIDVAKAIVDMAKDSESLDVKGAVINGEIFDGAQVRRIAELPPLPVLRARLLSVIQSPATQMAGVISGSVRQVVSVIKAHVDAEGAAA